LKKIIFILPGILLLSAATYYFYPGKKLPVDAVIDKIVVTKSERKLSVYSNGVLLKTYKVSLGGHPIGAKEFEGDKKTPEGVYHIYQKNPQSTCYKNLGISYPNADDLERCKQTGQRPGGNIKIHGMLNGQGYWGKFHRFRDWTAGCIAVTDEEMDELYEHTPVGTPIEIKP
jgi:murein L,D-transpeptidase YafK